MVCRGSRRMSRSAVLTIRCFLPVRCAARKHRVRVVSLHIGLGAGIRTRGRGDDMSVIGLMVHYRPYGGQPDSGVVKAVVPYVSTDGDRLEFYKLDNNKLVLSTECFIESDYEEVG